MELCCPTEWGAGSFPEWRLQWLVGRREVCGVAGAAAGPSAERVSGRDAVILSGHLRSFCAVQLSEKLLLWLPACH